MNQKKMKPEKLDAVRQDAQSGPGLMIYLVLLVLATVIPYAFSLGGEFVFDDKLLIIVDKTTHSLSNIPKAFAQPFIDDTTSPVKYYRPVVTVTFILNHAMFGQSPVGYKATNLLLHLIATLLVFVLSRRLLKNSMAALFAGLVFAVHPAHTESVAWISGRTDIVAAIFALASLISFGRYMSADNKKWYAASLGFLALGLLSKEIVIVVPVALLAMGWLGGKRLKWAEYVPFFIITALYLALRQYLLGHVITAGSEDSLSLGYRVLVAPVFMLWYLRILFLPKTAEPLYDVFKYAEAYPAIIAAGWILVMALTVYALVVRRRLSVVSFAIIWLMLTIIPVTNIIRLPWPVLCERFLYLPSVGFSLIFGLVFAWLVALRPKAFENIWPIISGTCATGVLIYCTMQTYAGAPLWSNNMALMSRMLSIAGDRLPMIHIYAGETYAARGELKKAVREYRIALADKPDDESTRAKLFAAYFQLGDYISAVKEAKILANQRPNDAMVLNDLGISLVEINDFKGAIDAFRRAAELEPRNARIRFNLARTLARNRDYAGAVKEYMRGLELKPGDGRAKRELESILKGNHKK